MALAPPITRVDIHGFKSIQELSFSPGRVTMFIGANGSGKSNLLEAVGLAAGACAGRLDLDALVSRGLRSTDPVVMRSGFPPYSSRKPITIEVFGRDDAHYSAELRLTKGPFPKWVNRSEQEYIDRLLSAARQDEDHFERVLKVLTSQAGRDAISRALQKSVPSLPGYMIYAPQVPTLRALRTESRVQPLGAFGEGLFRLVRELTKDPDAKSELESHLSVFDWFFGFSAVEENEERHVQAEDLYLDAKFGTIDELSVNEGFLVMLFYLCLMISPNTPGFFAIDNVDAGLNPKLAARAVELISILARQHNKQVLLTTHNPAALDGLDLHRYANRLYVVRREPDGETAVSRVSRTRLASLGEPIALSEAFLRGYLGGLPAGF